VARVGRCAETKGLFFFEKKNQKTFPGLVGLDIVADIDALPDGADSLLDSADSFFLSRTWWRTVQRAGLPAGAAPRFMTFTHQGRPAALFAMQARDGGRVLEAMTNPYTCLYRPLLAPGLDDATLHAIGRAFGRACRVQGSVRLDALPAEYAARSALPDGFRAAGLVLAPFDHFGNWHEPVAGLCWADYLATRRGELRETIRRKLRRAEVAHEVISTPDRVEAGIAVYEDIYARSWKVPEPYPNFNPTLMRQAAAAGALRLGVLRTTEKKPIAAQLWIVAHGQACVLKLAHDEAFKALSPGTVLTALMLRDLLDGERVKEIDFGRGDDPYKRLWTGHRRQRIGLLLINPRRPAGLAALARQLAGRVRRRLRPHPEQA